MSVIIKEQKLFRRCFETIKLFFFGVSFQVKETSITSKLENGSDPWLIIPNCYPHINSIFWNWIFFWLMSKNEIIPRTKTNFTSPKLNMTIYVTTKKEFRENAFLMKNSLYLLIKKGRKNKKNRKRTIHKK